MTDSTARDTARRRVDEVDRARAQEYALLAILLRRSPDAQLLSRLAGLPGDASPIGLAHIALAKAAGRAGETSAAQEFFTLFAGLGDGALMPYASRYLAGTLYGRPLARLRETLQDLRIEKSPRLTEPEDHAGFLCEIMAGLAGGTIDAADGFERDFFEQYISPWMGRFFADLEQAKSADFYASVGAFGHTFLDIEARAFALSE